MINSSSSSLGRSEETKTPTKENSIFRPTPKLTSIDFTCLYPSSASKVAAAVSRSYDSSSSESSPLLRSFSFPSISSLASPSAKSKASKKPNSTFGLVNGNDHHLYIIEGTGGGADDGGGGGGGGTAASKSSYFVTESLLQERVKFIKERMLLLVDLSGVTLRSLQDVNTVQQVLQESIGSHMRTILQTAQKHRKDKNGKLYFPATSSSSSLRQQQQYQMDCFVCYDNFTYYNSELWSKFQNTMEYLQQQFNFRTFEEFTCRTQFEDHIVETTNIMDSSHLAESHTFSRSLSPPKSTYFQPSSPNSTTTCSSSFGNITSYSMSSVLPSPSESTAQFDAAQQEPIVVKNVIEYCLRYSSPPTPKSSNHIVDEKNLKPADIYMIINEQFELYRILSKGTYGTVYKGLDKVTGKNVAVKELDLEMMDKIGAIEFAQRETFVYIVTEFCENGALENPLEEHEQHNEDDVQRYFVQMVMAIDHMHNVLSILHRDLTLSNVCLDADRNVKIVDFGLSDKFEKGKKYHRLFVGNGAYCCPELLLKKCYAEEIDIYALGVVLYKLLTGFLPFKTAKEKFEMNYYIPLEEEEGISEKTKYVIEHLLEVNSANRWTLEDVMQSDWFLDGYKKWITKK
ncbi:predicted protein [Naegleria gruberi]|uniref:Predicted protein n=1 Tax=Naegleria gruberi TaxID=5762 RepID=D2VYJ5_NAEGR|nr:uncharacterized protein NAEGRDRAFT_81718 [Naegleria gruberi]EFC38123.1 predicted protein [Naegleria gruberi]|eukprot:XP_002670867.1 predicted protein [Naegleria gruberi strain NEG-M]